MCLESWRSALMFCRLLSHGCRPNLYCVGDQLLVDLLGVDYDPVTDLDIGFPDRLLSACERFVTIGIGIRGRATECLSPVSGESLDMLGVEAVAERMGDHVVGHHPTMPGVGKTAQAVVATRRLEYSLHASMMTILPCLYKTMALGVQLGLQRFADLPGDKQGHRNPRPCGHRTHRRTIAFTPAPRFKFRSLATNSRERKHGCAN